MRILTSVFLLFLAVSCETADYNPEGQPAGACNVKDPVKELAWLNRTVEDFKRNMALYQGCALTIQQATYQGETVFLITPWGAACCGCSGTLYNCAGEVVKSCPQLDESYTGWNKVAELTPW